MKPHRQILALALALGITLGPQAGPALAAVEAESISEPAASGKSPSGAGAMATGLEAFKTDLATGSVSFRIPVELPPGTGGMQPEVTLGYSSAAGNGWAGFGWTLDLGRISRRTEHGVPTYDDAIDAFGLDGARLVLGADGNYHTETESFLRIRHLAAGTPADHWEVASKDGRRLIFGATTASRIADPADPGRIFAWLLDRAEDPFGNFLTVSYQDGGDAPNRYPAAVTYTFHAGPPEAGGLVGGVERRVEFCLEGSDDGCQPAVLAARPDLISSYTSGFRIQTSRRLGSIRTRVSGNLVRRYDLAYLDPGQPSGGSSATSRLAALTIEGSAGTKLPAMTFTYSPGATGYAAGIDWPNPSGPGDQFGKKYVEIRKQKASGAGLAGVIDLDGDGVPDRVTNGDALFWNLYRALPGGAGYGSREYWEYASGDQPSSFEAREITDLDGAHVQADVIDLDGDGLPDRVAERKDASGLWDVYWNDGSAFTEQAGGGPFTWVNPSGYLDDIYDSLRRYDGQGGRNLIAEIIDLNGDGVPDRVLGGKNSYPDPWKVYLSDGASGFTTAAIDWANPSGSEADGSNGDIQRRNNTGVLADLVDLNGDGLPDRVVKDARTAWKVWFNTGWGFESAARAWPNPSGDIKGAYEYLRAVGSESVLAEIADINGDGLPDRIVEGASNSDTFLVYLNTGSGFAQPPVVWANPSGAEGFKHPRDLSSGGQTLSDFVDIDGDGLLDRVIRTGSDGLWGCFLYDGVKPDLLTGIANGMGGAIAITYQASTRHLDARGSRANPDLPFPVQTVREVRRHDGIDAADDMVTTYEYTGGRYDAASREFRGFAEVTVTEGGAADPSGTVTLTRFHQDDALKGQVERLEIRDSAGALLSEVRNVFLSPGDPDHALVSASGGGASAVALVKRAEATLYGATAQATTAVSFRYDAIGNVLEKIEEGLVPPGGAPDGDERKTCITYAPWGADYRGGFPTEIAVVPGDAPCATQEASRTRFAYAQATDPDGFWISRKDWLRDDVNGLDEEIETVRAADPYGNLRSLTDARGNATTIAYDGDDGCPFDPAATASHTFPCLVTNAKGHKQGYLHDPGSGNLVSRTDPNDHRTLFFHDDLGRVISERFIESGAPSGVVIRDYAYPALPGESVPPEGTWGTTHGPGAQNLRRIDYAVASAGPLRDEGVESRDFVDGLGRVVRTRRDGDDQRPVDAEADYDDRGRLRRQYLPHFADGEPSPGFTGFAYDALGRVTEVRHPDGNCTASAHEAFTEILERRDFCDAPARVAMRRESRRDARGNVVEVKEFPDPEAPGGFHRTTYRYDLLDNLVEIRDACANDPAACDPARPATQRHAAVFTYDTLSRKVRADDPALGSWDYLHDSVGNLVRQKDARPSPLYGEVTFVYDEINRLLSKEYQDPAQRDIQFEYDQGGNGLGRLSAVADEAGRVFYEYDARGDLVHFIRDFTDNNKRFEYFYAYDNLRRLLDVALPRDRDGASVGHVTYDYADGSGRQTPFVQAVSGPAPGGAVDYLVHPGIDYDALGNLTRYVDGAGVEAFLTHDPRTSRMTSRWAVGNTVWMAQQYRYEPVTGQLGSIVNLFAEAPDQSFPAYDGLGRLLEAEGPWGPGGQPAQAAYAYDPLGNIVLKDDVPSSPGAGKMLFYEHPRNPQAVTRLETAEAAGTRHYVYDPNGNLIQRISSENVRTFAWDQDNRLVSVQQAGMGTRRFTYDYRGERVLSEWGTSRLYMPTWDFEWSGDNQANAFVFLGGTRVASIGLSFTPPGVPAAGTRPFAGGGAGDAAGRAAAGLSPFLGLTVLLWLARWWWSPGRAGGGVLARRGGIALLIAALLLATGTPAAAIGPPYAGHLNVLIFYQSDYKGSTTSVYDGLQNGQQRLDYWPFGDVRQNLHSPTIDVRHKFTGQELDDRFDIYYYGGRWYDSQIGRFISPDPLLPEPLDPQLLNRYAYVANDPVNLVDPGGHFLGILVAAVVSAAVAAAKVAVIGAAVGAAVNGLVAAGTGRPVGAAIAQGALLGALGAITGAAAGSVAGSLAGGLAETIGASRAIVDGAAGIGRAALRGAAGGAVIAAIAGRDAGEGAGLGALAGLAGALAATAASMAPSVARTLVDLAGYAKGRLSDDLKATYLGAFKGNLLGVLRGARNAAVGVLTADGSRIYEGLADMGKAALPRYGRYFGWGHRLAGEPLRNSLDLAGSRHDPFFGRGASAEVIRQADTDLLRDIWTRGPQPGPYGQALRIGATPLFGLKIAASYAGVLIN